MSRDEPAIKRLIREMQRRRVFRTAALYIVGTWLVLQVADVVFPALDIPDRAIRYLLLAALLGFPAALVFGWFYDVGMDGIRRTGPAGSAGETAPRALRRSDFVILTALIAVIAAILYNAVGNVIETPGEVQRAPREGPPMVAVLPFISKNPAAESESFAAGVHDDLLTQLSKLQSVRVISRTSVMEYHNVARNIRKIGAALGADAILEGGVQSAGNRIRINVQLIDAYTDEHLWAETYDRELTLANIFEVQSEIARAITSAMRATLSQQDSTELAVIPTENMAAYRAYHQAIELRDGRMSPTEDVIALFEKAVALDPTFTRAWAELAGSLSMHSFDGSRPEQIDRAEQALEKIRAIAPDSADYLIAKTYFTYYVLKEYDLASELVTQARELVPSDVRLAEVNAWIQRRQGDYEGWLESLRQAQLLNPGDVRTTHGLLQALMRAHRSEDARALIEKTPFDDYFISYVDELISLDEHRDTDRFVQAIAELQSKFEEHGDDYGLWAAHVTNRDFQEAEKLLSGMPGSPSDPFPQYRYFMKLDFQIITHWLLGESEAMPGLIEQYRARIELDRNEDGDFAIERRILDLAMAFAVEGNREDAEVLVNRWFRTTADDLAGLMVNRDLACRILGIAGSTQATECLRAALEKPSMVMFSDLYLPFYDAIRNEPEFVELLAEAETKTRQQ